MLKVKQTEKEPDKLESAEGLSVQTIKELADEDLADEYGNLEFKVKAIMSNPILAQFDEVKKELLSRLQDQLEPQDEAELQGNHYVLEIGACPKLPRKMKPGSIETVRTLLGPATFPAVAKVNVGDLDKYLSEEEAKQVVEESKGYSDKRQIKAKFIG